MTRPAGTFQAASYLHSGPEGWQFGGRGRTAGLSHVDALERCRRQLRMPRNQSRKGRILTLNIIRLGLSKIELTSKIVPTSKIVTTSKIVPTSKIELA